MKLSISNIAWSENDDPEMYDFIKSNNYNGIEIAPTRIIENDPYNNLDEIQKFSRFLSDKYQLEISSMQSICFGRQERIFGTEDERNILLNYLKKSIDFASVIKCKNLVFGSPKNRIIGNNQEKIGYTFFEELGNYAQLNNTVFALEPNPIIYGTNFINTSQEAFNYIKEINIEGLRVNFDLGTFIQNQETLDSFEQNLPWINHIHISEPYLEVIKERKIHQDLINILINNKYDKYISIEMKNSDSLESVKNTMLYIKNLFYVS